MSQVPDPAFMEAINQNMHVPEHLSVSGEQQWEEEKREEATKRREGLPPFYTMQVPDRLTYTEAPDMNPRPLFTSSKLGVCGPLGLEPCWESHSGEVSYREVLQSPIRRSFSDQSFGRTPPGTPTRLKQTLALPRHPFSFRESGRLVHDQTASSAILSTKTTNPQAQPFLSTHIHVLSPQSVLHVAKQLGLKASQYLLQMVTQKYSKRSEEEEKSPPGRVLAEVLAVEHVEHSKTRAIESWSAEEDGGAAVEFLILRRQVMKMSRRLAALERHSTERRNTEFVMFSLFLSACLLNVWLWIRR